MIVPGRTYLLTRRCAERRMLMRPDRETTDAYVYCLAVSAQRFDLDVLAFSIMSNHHHLVVVDKRGSLPAFLQYFHRLFAAHQNVLRGRSEAFWAGSEQTSVVELVEVQDILDKMAYAICNPVLSDLVDMVEDWPGPNVVRAIFQRRQLVAQRPPRFFRRSGRMPPIATLTFAPPPGCGAADASWREHLLELVNEKQLTAKARRRVDKKKVLGPRGVLAQDWRVRPRSSDRRGTLKPQVAARNRWARAETLRRNRRWLEAYSRCRAAWAAGDPNVVFPAGVWWLSQHAPASCAPWEDRPLS